MLNTLIALLISSTMFAGILDTAIDYARDIPIVGDVLNLIDTMRGVVDNSIGNPFDDIDIDPDTGEFTYQGRTLIEDEDTGTANTFWGYVSWLHNGAGYIFGQLTPILLDVLFYFEAVLLLWGIKYAIRAFMAAMSGMIWAAKWIIRAIELIPGF